MPGARPQFSGSPAALVGRFDELAALVPDATRRPMFGYPSLVLSGHMFMSLFGDRLVLRLGEGDRAEFTAQYGSSAFEPMPGRPMTGYVTVPPGVTASAAVEQWVRQAHANAATMPPKKPKPPRKRPS